eukprot:TRINITY_DN3029_c0_g1_i1.p1 TRINITY_DN3029_c0_g1~~TRINITY_DN3029_c0_g1_i1.p1  ORF type:complete len:353 (-),score=72.70 TRINITY_DN3029_c0_g1_i1:131-1189(-)
MASIACPFIGNCNITKWRKGMDIQRSPISPKTKWKSNVKLPTVHLHSPFSPRWIATSRLSHRPKVIHSDDEITSSSGDPEFIVLTSVLSKHNKITILEVPQNMKDSPFAGSRLLLLDDSNNIHSIYRKEETLTGFYWDEFSSLPGIVPAGPIAILGLGAGTAARTMLDLWPSLKLYGWEIDQILVDMARAYLGLAELEKQTTNSGVLHVYIGDALSPSATIPGGFSGIVVDLFADGKVLPQLQQAETWVELRERLAPGGRIMVNCGGACVESRDSTGEIEIGTWTWQDGMDVKDATVEALSIAFPFHELSWKRMDNESGNYLFLTGPFPNLDAWAAAIPECLRARVYGWNRY